MLGIRTRVPLIGDLYGKATMAEPCNRCGKAGVQLLTLSKRIRTVIFLAVLAALPLVWVGSEYDYVYWILLLISSGVDLFLSERAYCGACGATLQKEIGQGWR